MRSTAFSAFALCTTWAGIAAGTFNGHKTGSRIAASAHFPTAKKTTVAYWRGWGENHDLQVQQVKAGHLT